MKSICYGIAISLSLGLSGCQQEKLDEKADGKALFVHYCEECHGDTGNGKFLKGIPSNTATRLTRQEVVNLLLYGREDQPAMPTFRDQLSPRQARKVADYLLFNLKKS
ncbi:cytochrome c [Pontibacterium granulatum]|uniref:c-type cytochrome n=1 Tax=Pontibacterium granulatum TaxID=2036029 RepID=UPI00249C94F0|nr:cytochrome c [Pontibacterium granulatum]MDI3326492.1 cytochrome c [Pontibacterium granulatum]